MLTSSYQRTSARFYRRYKGVSPKSYKGLWFYLNLLHGSKLPENKIGVKVFLIKRKPSNKYNFKVFVLRMYFLKIIPNFFTARICVRWLVCIMLKTVFQFYCSLLFRVVLFAKFSYEIKVCNTTSAHGLPGYVTNFILQVLKSLSVLRL